MLDDAILEIGWENLHDIHKYRDPEFGACVFSMIPLQGAEDWISFCDCINWFLTLGASVYDRLGEWGHTPGMNRKIVSLARQHPCLKTIFRNRLHDGELMFRDE